MDILKYILKVLYQNKWWIIIIPIFAFICAILLTRNISKTYKVTSTVYTGIASGYNIESDIASKTDYNSINNEMDNLINIVKAQSTLEKVSIRLYAQHMIYGNNFKDNNYIQATNFNAIYNKTPIEIRKLIDKTSEANTIARLLKHQTASPDNFVYGLFNWNHHHYSYKALSKVEVRRVSNSDMLELSYEGSDPGVVYNTLKILTKEFIENYQSLRFQETDSVIEYFRNELDRIALILRSSEDSLTNFNVNKKVINYDEQTKQVTSKYNEYFLKHSETKMAYNSSKALLNEIEKRMSDNINIIKNNSEFIEKIQKISDLNYKIQYLKSNSSDIANAKIKSLKKQLNKEEENINNIITEYKTQKYTKEGLAKESITDQWLIELMNNIKAKAQLEVLNELKKEIDAEYSYYSPIGSTIKRREREISFLESSYLNILNSLNGAMTRKKNLQMSSAALKVLNPPIFPLDPLPSKRKLIVLGVFIASFIFTVSYFLIIEVIDRTLRNKIRAELLIGNPVLGAFPKPSKIKYRNYQNEVHNISANYLFNSVSNYFDSSKKINIVNIISNNPEEGKTYIAENLLLALNQRGIESKLLNHENDYNPNSSEYLLANSMDDIYIIKNEKVIIIEHPCLKGNNIPDYFIKNASLNLHIVSANRAWTDTDNLLFKRLSKKSKNNPLFIYLSKTSRETLEVFTGLLPPYTTYRKILYKILQFELKSK
ncbi:MAG: hypothetical protein H6Q15_17 [Bacteroidetes bacterium]|nr:hypothetical protein [Bacteroidota bacterium]